MGKVVEHTFDSEDKPGTSLRYTGTVTRIFERKKNMPRLCTKMYMKQNMMRKQVMMMKTEMRMRMIHLFMSYWMTTTEGI